MGSCSTSTSASDSASASASDSDSVSISDSDGAMSDDCNTDNDDEMAHDHVKCKSCGTTTHVSNGKCSYCGLLFKFTATGYLIDGEDDGFICDDNEELSSMSDDSYIGSGSGSDESDEYDSDSDDDSSDDSDNEMIIVDDHVEYTKDIDIDVIRTLPRRITRSKTNTI